MIGNLDHVQIVLDHNDRVPRIDKPVENMDQLVDIGDMKAGCRLVPDNVVLDCPRRT